jgi:sirohydrochlorin ferrochelatase
MIDIDHSPMIDTGGGAQAGVLLVAHGSRDPAAARTVEAVATGVRARLGGATVRVAFLDHGTPDVATALLDLDRPVVVPLLLAAGFHSEVDLPRLVGGRGVVTPVLGPDALLVEAVERRLRSAGAWPGEAAVVLAAAGSSGAHARPATEWVAERLAARGWGPVQPAYASAATPTVPDAVARLRADGHARVVVASYLLAPGRFHTALHAAGADVVTAPLGAASEAVELVARRVAGALGSAATRAARPVPRAG